MNITDLYDTKEKKKKEKEKVVDFLSRRKSLPLNELDR